MLALCTLLSTSPVQIHQWFRAYVRPWRKCLIETSPGVNVWRNQTSTPRFNLSTWAQPSDPTQPFITSYEFLTYRCHVPLPHVDTALLKGSRTKSKPAPQIDSRPLYMWTTTCPSFQLTFVCINASRFSTFIQWFYFL